VSVICTADVTDTGGYGVAGDERLAGCLALRDADADAHTHADADTCRPRDAHWHTAALQSRADRLPDGANGDHPPAGDIHASDERQPFEQCIAVGVTRPILEPGADADAGGDAHAIPDALPGTARTLLRRADTISVSVSIAVTDAGALATPKRVRVSRVTRAAAGSRSAV
jgi:hypothetical protein